MKVWLNGRLLDEKRASLSVFDHGFLYGDGLYETVRLDAQGISLWPAHYQRLKKSARHFHFSFPWSHLLLEKAVLAVAKANHRTQAAARISLSRGPGPLGLDPALCIRPTLMIQLHPDHAIERRRREGVAVGILKIQQPSRESLDPGFKSTSMQHRVLAKMEAQRLGVAEGLLLNARQEVTEGITSNLFFVRRGILYTPALSCGLLPGITRAQVLRIARRRGISVREGRFRAAHLMQAEELFLTNASVEILPVVSLKMGPRVLRLAGPRGAMVQRLQEAWTQSML